MSEKSHEQPDQGYQAHYDKVLTLGPNAAVEDVRKIYVAWSDTYDKDSVGPLGYVGPVMAAEQLAQKLKELGYGNDVRILDLGCGTGQVGEALKKRGYTFIDGLDNSPEMLEKANQKGVYRELSQGAMGSDESKDLAISRNQYDAAICVGVFSIGHVKGKGFDDLLHVLKPGGLACFTIRDCIANDPDYGYQEKMSQLSAEGKWNLVGKSYENYTIDEPKCWVYIYQRL